MSQGLYSLDVVPSWCGKPVEDHADIWRGCYGILCGSVSLLGERYCLDCTYRRSEGCQGSVPEPLTKAG